MSVVVDVGLISGKTVSVEARLDEPVATLKRCAQNALAVAKGRLVDSRRVLCYVTQHGEKRTMRSWHAVSRFLP